METNDQIGKYMISKLKESYSLKSFSSIRYQSSLICNSKTFRLDVDLINGTVLNSSKGKKFPTISSGNVPKQHEKASSWQVQNLENSKIDSKFTASSSRIRKSRRIEANKTIASSKNSPKSSIKSKIPVKHSHDARIRVSFNPVQSKVKQNCSDFNSFRCDVCMKYFSSKRNVKRHSILHSSERHACEACGKVFQTKENLKRHCRAMHEVKVKSIDCSKCFKAFSRIEDLNKHLKKHPDHGQHSSVVSTSANSFDGSD